MLKNLIDRFQLEKECTPSHINELLDFLQKAYISGQLSIVEYKMIFSELDKQNAEKPVFYF
ncbi:YppF family protein [Bacillus sp. B15-48]|uniref:YppF family protein n=1 Tax=Bacillus sp. B15-48 TaxID=1548601 RepID=UPI001EF17733|nr:YppF family protein [Bacillus sp. B15-48]